MSASPIRPSKSVPTQQSGVDTGLSKPLWQKAFDFSSENNDWTREELNEVLHWVKQCIAVFLGAGCGILQVQGWMGFLVLAIGIVLTGVYVQKLNTMDEVMDMMESYQEGTVPAAMSFVLFWVVSYTLIHF